MSERNSIFSRIRAGLQTPARHAGHGPLPTVADYRRVLPAVGQGMVERVEQFRNNAAELKADFVEVATLEALNTQLARLARAEGWKRVAAQATPLTEPACLATGLPVCWTDQGYDVQVMEQCEAGISECEALIAQTGSVLVTSRTSGGRGISVLPPHHVVLARREQLVADLPEAFALVKARFNGNFPSMISFITGPSRTGDIERILVLGAHGPKKLTIFLVG